MAYSLRPLTLLVVVIALLALPGAAQTPPKQSLIPKEKGAARTVALFDFLCLKQLPDLEGIERAAGFGEFDQLIGEDLAPYVPEGPVEKVFAWRYHDHGEQFVLTAQRAAPDPAIAKEMPALATATDTACALRMASTKPDALIGELTRVLGRAADKTWQDGTAQVREWKHAQSGALSFVRYYAPEKSGATAVLSASVLLKR
jgi:hypothetical protein